MKNNRFWQNLCPSGLAMWQFITKIREDKFTIIYAHSLVFLYITKTMKASSNNKLKVKSSIIEKYFQNWLFLVWRIKQFGSESESHLTTIDHGQKFDILKKDYLSRKYYTSVHHIFWYNKWLHIFNITALVSH